MEITEDNDIQEYGEKIHYSLKDFLNNIKGFFSTFLILRSE
jgi:hypothetical protein